MDISYNGIEFDIVKTNELSTTPVWSEDGTTYLYSRVFIDVEGIMNPEAMAYLIVGNEPEAVSGSLPPTTIKAIRHALEQPRAPLLITSQSGVPLAPTIEVIQSPVEGYPCDLNNGPKPGPCRIYNLSGAKTWYISWTCETWIHECPNEDTLDSPLISNRYSREDQIDAQFKSTIVTSGVAVFRTDILEANSTVADDFRYAILPPVPLGFQRRRISVVAVPNRNALRWSTTDEEKMFDLGDTSNSGSYITDIQGTFGVSSITTPEGIPNGQSLGQLFVRVIGTKQASNWVLTQRAFGIAATKIPFGDPNSGVIRQISVTQSLVDRDVSLNVVFWFVRPNPAVIGSVAVEPLRVDAVFADQGGVNPSPPWGQGTQGTSQLELLVAALEDACTGAASPPCNEQGGTEGGGTQCGPAPVISVTADEELPSYPTNYNELQTPGSYNTYDMKTRYFRRSNILQAPIAGLPSNSSQGNMQFSQGNGPTASFFRLAQPTSTIEVTWRAERVGTSPLIPDPNTNNPNYVLLEMEVIPTGPQVMPDSTTYVFAVSGRYVFGAVTAMGLNDPLGAGAIPWVAANFIELQVASTDYTQGIFDSGDGNFS